MTDKNPKTARLAKIIVLSVSLIIFCAYAIYEFVTYGVLGGEQGFALLQELALSIYCILLTSGVLYVVIKKKPD